jgi:multiple sugar transport system substrate-binding protein
MKPFPAIILGIFAILAAASVVILATFSTGGQKTIGSVVVWGSLPSAVMEDVLNSVRGTRDDFGDVTYRPVSEDALVPKLVESIASGTGPDLVMFPSSYLVRESNKLVTIPYASYPKRTFQDTFIQAGEPFLYPDGVKGLPFVIDPLVMYWNRTMFAAAGIAQPPRYWDELPQMVSNLTKVEQNGTLKTSAFALGSWDNIVNSKDILLTLLSGLGNPVITRAGNGFTSTLSASASNGTGSAASAVRYFAQFSDPVKPVYTWNRSQPASRDAFLKGTLAVYFGPASELLGIRTANPNLNFDVAEMPNVRGGVKGASSHLFALSIPNGSKNPVGALTVATILTSADVQRIVNKETRLPSVRRDVTVTSAADAYQTVFRSASLTAFSFLDPDPSATEGIFRRLIENVLSGKLKEEAAASSADQELIALIGRSQ